MAKRKRDRWYTMSGQSRSHSFALERSSGTRRIFSLVVLLVLVLILIQQTSDPRRVGRVATSIGLLPNSTANSPSETVTESNSSKDRPAAFSRPIATELLATELLLESTLLLPANDTVHLYSQFWQAVFRNAPPKIIESLSRKLFLGQFRSNTSSAFAPNEEIQAWFDASADEVNRWLAAPAQSPSIAATLSQFQTDLANFAPEFLASIDKRQNASTDTAVAEPIPSVPESEILRSLRLALDRHLLQNAVDAAPWKSTERVLFLRTWERVDTLRRAFETGSIGPDNFPSVDIGQLVAQSDFHRGKPLRIRGEIAKIDSDGDISEPGIAPRQYNAFWIKPNDESLQPICIYAMPESRTEQLKFEEGALVEIIGIYVKRIAYASQRGSDVAPVVFAAFVDTASTLRPKYIPNESQIAFDEWVSKSGSSERWLEPIDLSGPWQLVQQRIHPIVEKLQSELLVDSVDNLVNQASVLTLLSELDKLSPEIDKITSGEASLELNAHAKLTKVAGQIQRVQRINIDTNKFPALASNQVFLGSLNENGDSSSTQDSATPSESHDVATKFIANQVPAFWLSSDVLKQPATITGIVIDLPNASPQKIVITKAPTWSIQRSNPTELTLVPELSPSLNASWQVLLARGWNLGWVDAIRSLHNKPLSQQDTAPLISLIRHSDDFAEPQKGAGKPERPIAIPIIEVLRSPQNHLLEMTRMNARIVRIQKIRVEDTEQSHWIGTDHYYQMDAFADIGRTAIQLQGSKDDEPIVFHRDFPVTLVSKSLPSWLESEVKDNQEVWYPRTTADVSGWFYRFWSYKTQQMSAATGDLKKQISPLIVIESIRLGARPDPVEYNRSWNFTPVITAIVGIAAAGWFAWRLTAWQNKKKKISYKARP